MFFRIQNIDGNYSIIFLKSFPMNHFLIFSFCYSLWIFFNFLIIYSNYYTAFKEIIMFFIDGIYYWFFLFDFCLIRSAERKFVLFGVALFRIFLHLGRIRRDTDYLSVFIPNTGKYRPEKIWIWTPFTQWRI